MRQRVTGVAAMQKEQAEAVSRPQILGIGGQDAREQRLRRGLVSFPLPVERGDREVVLEIEAGRVARRERRRRSRAPRRTDSGPSARPPGCSARRDRRGKGQAVWPDGRRPAVRDIVIGTRLINVDLIAITVEQAERPRDAAVRRRDLFVASLVIIRDDFQRCSNAKDFTRRVSWIRRRAGRRLLRGPDRPAASCRRNARCSRQAPAVEADLVVVNARVHTMEPAAPRAEAFAVKDGALRRRGVVG